jgi:transposase
MIHCFHEYDSLVGDNKRRVMFKCCWCGKIAATDQETVPVPKSELCGPFAPQEMHWHDVHTERSRRIFQVEQCPKR